MTRNNIVIKKHKAVELMATPGSILDQKNAYKAVKQLTDVFYNKNKSIFQNKSEKGTGQFKISI